MLEPQTPLHKRSPTNIPKSHEIQKVNTHANDSLSLSLKWQSSSSINLQCILIFTNTKRSFLYMSWKRCLTRKDRESAYNFFITQEIEKQVDG